jgi:hypothetical protein
MKQADKKGVYETVLAMNSHIEDDRRLSEVVLAGTFESLWPKLETRLNAVSAGPEARERSDRELLEEILHIVRASIFRTSRSSGEGALSSPSSINLSRQFLSELRRIAGPEGSIMVSGTEPVGVIVTVPRLADLSSDDTARLGMVRDYLLSRGMKLRVTEEIND